MRQLIITILFIFGVAGAGTAASQGPALEWLAESLNAATAAGGNDPGYRFWATVTRVADGDTVTVRKKDGSTVRIRLLGIDAPEVSHGRGQPGQPAGQYARQALAARVLNRTVLIVHRDTWSYDRLLAHVIQGGKDQCYQQVRLGAAWQYDRYSDDPRLAALERAAREAGVGIWSRPAPVPPWTWRGRH